MGRRTSYDKDEMITRCTDFSAATDPSEGDALVSMEASEAGQVMAVSWVWDASSRGMFHLEVNGERRYSFASGGSGWAGVTECLGRISFEPDDTVRVVAAADLTGTFAGAIVYADS